MPTFDHRSDIVAAQRFFAERGNVEYLWEPGSPELLYMYRILKRLCSDPVTCRLNYYVTNEAPLPRTGKDVVAVQIGNEDHAIPGYIDDVLLVFTPYPPVRSAPRNFLPIPLGYNGYVPELPVKAFDARTLDAFFSGQSRNDRWKIGAGVESLVKSNETGKYRFHVEYTESFRAGMSPEQYARCLRDARIAFAPRGTSSPVTFRFFEAARAGNAIISCRLPDTWYYRPFPGVQLDDWDFLPEALGRLLADPAGLALMGARTRWYYREFCSERAVAGYMRRAIMKSRPRTSSSVQCQPGVARRLSPGGGGRSRALDRRDRLRPRPGDAP